MQFPASVDNYLLLFHCVKLAKNPLIAGLYFLPSKKNAIS
jgi:hypothetical protein